MRYTVEAIVISLKSARDRRDMLRNNLEFKENISWSFFDAANHNTMIEDLIVDRGLQVKNYGRHLTNGEIGCFKSHFLAWKNFCESGTADWLLVLEDDTWIDPDFQFETLIEYLFESKIKYIRLFAKAYKPAKVISYIDNYRQIIRFDTDPYGTQAYLINKQGCQVLLRHAKSIDVPVDDFLGRFWLHGLDAYSIFPFPIVERSVNSSLTSERDALQGARSGNFRKTLMRRVWHKGMKIIYNTRYNLTSLLRKGRF